MARADKRYEAPQTAAVLVAAPGANLRLEIQRIVVSVDSDTDVTVFADTDAEGNRLVDGFFGARGGIAQDYGLDNVEALPRNKALKITTTAGKCRVVVHYKTGN